MNQRIVIIFAVFSIYSVLFPQECEGLHGLESIVHLGTKGAVSGVKKSTAVAKGAATSVKSSVFKGSVIGAKKALLLAPVVVPLAIGSKALLAAKLAVPMGIGAAIGAPIGAVIGAKAGALKGAIIGKAIIAAKLAAAKKVAVKATAIAVKPVVIVAGIKAKIAGAGLKLVGKGVAAAGAAVSKAGAKITSISNRLSSYTSDLTQKLTPSIPTFTLPQLPALPALSLPIAKSKGPTAIEYSFVVNGPHTGYKTKKASFYSNRRRREASPEAAPEPQGNTQQLLQLVRSQDAQQCLQRVICELSANPSAHGSEGVRFGRSLILLESQTDRAAAQQYRQAASAGTQVGNAQFCTNFYPSCAFQSNEIIRIGNQMIEG